MATTAAAPDVSLTTTPGAGQDVDESGHATYELCRGAVNANAHAHPHAHAHTHPQPQPQPHVSFHQAWDIGRSLDAAVVVVGGARR